MNKHLRNLNKIEFVITYACSGRCKHCSEGEHNRSGLSFDKDIAVYSVKRISEDYNIKTCMTFGGEPLLYSDTVCAIHNAAREVGIEHRQIITNGYFSCNKDIITSTAKKIAECGANDVLLSVDAFHQETIPLDTVLLFACEILRCNVPVRTQPAWLVNREHDNKYNNITHSLLARFEEIGIPQNEGNVIFPSGNALKYLNHYFDAETIPQNPYVEDPYNIKTVSFDPDGSVLGENCYNKDIIDILSDYDPKR